MQRIAILFVLMSAAFVGILISSGFAEKTVSITDQTGKKWDVTQAASLGFKPEKFQYGIGMNAFTTLNNSHLSGTPGQLEKRQRVIGVQVDDEAHAYSVRRLRYHEIANTQIAGRSIAAGF